MAMTVPKGSGPGLLRRIAMSAVMTLGLLGVFEAGMAGLGVGTSELYQGDYGFYWTLKSDLSLAEVDHVEEGSTFSVQTSDLGLRDEALPTGKPWILALGCSTTFGWGVEAAQAWPEQLQERLGLDVVNAGVPGHSTHQGLTFAPPLLAKGPAVAILGWGVRDAQKAPRPDTAAQPTPFPRNTHLYRWLRDLLPPPASPATVHRVEPQTFVANLRQIVESAQASDVKILLLDFPSRSPSEAHGAALNGLGLPVIRPQLPDAAFFSTDPIHLTVEGNRLLADAMEASIRSVLNPSP